MVNTSHVPTFRDINKNRRSTATGASLAGYTHGPRWARIVLDRGSSWLPGQRWPDGATRPLLAGIAADMSTLMVHSHADGLCWFSSFVSDFESLYTPIKCADAMVAVMVTGELGDTSMGDWFAPVVNAAAERVRAIPNQVDRCAQAGPIADEMAKTIARMWRSTRTERTT